MNIEKVIKEFNEKYEYDPISGNVLRRYTHKNFKKGDVVGTLTKAGTIDIRVCGKKYPAHNLIWLVTHGELPERRLVHKNGVNSDNRLDNLEITSLKHKQAKARRDKNKELKDKVIEIPEAKENDVMVNITGGNKHLLEEIGYVLPYGINYKYPINKYDLIKIGSNQKIDIECNDCGKVFKTKAYRAKDYKCRSCVRKGKEFTEEHKRKISENRKGKCLGEDNYWFGYRYESPESHPSYNSELTDEDREERRLIDGYREWAYNVKAISNFTCQVCGDNKGGNLVSHHIDSYNKYKEKRLDLDNGVCLCNKCHKDFHGKYGYGDNTSEQFEEWRELR